MEMLGKIPLKGEKVEINNLILTTNSADTKRVREVKVTIS